MKSKMFRTSIYVMLWCAVLAGLHGLAGCYVAPVTFTPPPPDEPCGDVVISNVGASYLYPTGNLGYAIDMTLQIENVGEGQVDVTAIGGSQSPYFKLYYSNDGINMAEGVAFAQYPIVTGRAISLQQGQSHDTHLGTIYMKGYRYIIAVAFTTSEDSSVDFKSNDCTPTNNGVVFDIASICANCI